MQSIAVGTRLGRFVVEDEIGVGGMGRILRAHDPELQRHVAIKLLHADTPEANARTLREAQALAKLAHPNVVAVYDVGEARGCVFFAMELVVGETLRDWLRAGPRPWPDVLAKFRAAGEGLAAAHRSGLVHRDFKPANVLLGRDGRVQVTDFGLARGGSLSTDSVPSSPSVEPGVEDRITAHGVVLGTPPYMAPEQHRGLGGDARSDQYSFCVALYEGLFGVRPFLGETMAELATAKHSGRLQPPLGTVSVPRWLQRVVARGLATAPEDRWPSLDALLHALEHRRPRGMLLGVGAVGAAVVATLIVLPSVDERCAGADDRLGGVWDDDARARVHTAFTASGTPYASAMVERVSSALDRYADAWIESRTEACAATRLRHEQSAEILDARMQCLDGRKRSLAAVVQTLAAADAVVVQNALRTIDGLPALASCERVDPAAAGDAMPEDPRLRAEIERANDDLARARSLLHAEKVDEARAAADAAMRTAEELDHAQLRAEANLRLGMIEGEAGHFAEAESRLTAAFFGAREAGLVEVAADASTELVFVVGNELARTREGMQWAEQARVAVEASTDPTDESALASTLGALHFAAGELDLAQAQYERALQLETEIFGEGDSRSAQTLLNLCSVHGARAEHERALECARRVLEIRERTVGPDHPATADALGNIGNAHLVREEVDLALESFRRAVAIYEASLGPEHPSVAKWLNNLGYAQSAANDLDGALATHLRVVELRERIHGRSHPMVARALIGVGNVYRARADLERAQAAYERAAAIFEEVHGADHPDTAMAKNNLGVVLETRKRNPEALAAYRGALAIFAKSLGADHPHTASAHNNIGNVLGAMGDFAGAIAAHERALAIRERVLPPGHAQTEEVRKALTQDRADLAASRRARR